MAARLGCSAAVALFALLLSGCGSSQGSSLQVVETNVFARTAEATSAMKSAGYEYQEVRSGGDIVTHVVGSFDLVNGRVRAVSTFTVSRDAAEPTDPATVAAFNNPTEYVLTGHTVFVRGGFAVGLQAQSDGTSGDLQTRLKQWFKIDLARLGATSDADVQSSLAEPDRLWRRIAALSTEPQMVGKQDIRGTATVQWRTAISLAELAEVAKKSGVDSNIDLTKLGSLVDERVVVINVWIDQSGRIRRETESVDVDAAIAAWRRDNPPSTASTPLVSIGAKGQLPNLSQVMNDPRVADELAEDLLRNALDVTTTWELYDIDKPVQIDPPGQAIDVTDQLINTGK